jgi:hypothetical protein
MVSSSVTVNVEFSVTVLPAVHVVCASATGEPANAAKISPAVILPRERSDRPGAVYERTVLRDMTCSL